MSTSTISLPSWLRIARRGGRSRRQVSTPYPSEQRLMNAAVLWSSPSRLAVARR
jgi:hypothetical protein